MCGRFAELLAMVRSLMVLVLLLFPAKDSGVSLASHDVVALTETERRRACCSDVGSTQDPTCYDAHKGPVSCADHAAGLSTIVSSTGTQG